jgi:signal transduction histidine kinase
LRKFTFIIIILFLGCSKGKKSDDVKSSKILMSNFTYLEDINLSVDDKVLILKKTEKILKDQPNSKENRLFLNKLAEQSYRIGSSKIMFSTTKLLLNRATIVNDSSNIAAGFNLLGKYYLDFSKNDSSFIYFVKAEKIYIKQKNNNKLGDINLNKAFIYLYENDYPNCEVSASKALLNIVFNGKNQRKKYDAYNLIGISSNELKKYDKAIEYHLKALKVANNSLYQTSPILITTSQNNLGVVYQNINDNKKAINFFQQALAKKGLENISPDLYAMLLDNLAYSKFKIGDNSELPNLFFTSLKIREKNHLNSGVVVNKIHLSEYFSALNDTVNSKKFAFEALVLAKSINIKGDILASLNQLSSVDKVKSSIYSKEYIEISDSLQLEERNSKDKFARIQFETDEIIQEKDILEDRNRNLLYVFIFTVILASLLFIVRAQRTRTRELLYKQTQQKANEEIFNLMMSQQAIIDESRSKEKKRLARDLHDGVLGRMFGLRMNLDSLNNKNDEDTVNRRLELLNELKTIEQDIREISHDLNREKQELINNFVSLVHNLLEEQQASYQVKLSYSIDNNVNWDKINNSIKINMYRMLQEGLQNINKYANAKNSTVEIKADEENIYLKIKDDGIGFDVNKKSKGIGVQNMISRTHECQGTIDIKSEKDNGTQIIITIPIITKQIIEAQA